MVYFLLPRTRDVFSQGRTKAEAEQNLADALYSFLDSCYEAGTLDKVLHEAVFCEVRSRIFPISP